MKKIAAASIVVAAAALSGCTTLFGQSQKTSEAEYTTAAMLADAGILSGKESPDIVGDTCLADGVNYATVIAGRSSADTFSYVPADNAHAKLQGDGAPIAPVQCKPVK